MSGNSLTTASTLQCPHGGSVQIVSSNTKVKFAGSPAATSTDTFTISGCPFQIPATPPIPSPCVRVQWLMADLKVKANSAATLSQSSVGLCLSAAGVPQGPVTVASTQAKVSSQ